MWNYIFFLKIVQNKSMKFCSCEICKNLVDNEELQICLVCKTKYCNNVPPCLYLQLGKWQNSSSCHSRVWIWMAMGH